MFDVPLVVPLVPWSFGPLVLWSVFQLFSFSAFSEGHPPATIFTISIRSPACNRRLPNSDGATAWPLCSTTTLRGKSCCDSRKSSIEQGTPASTSFPFAITDRLFIPTDFGLWTLDFGPETLDYDVRQTSQSFHTGSYP